jgi:hypothetical protein
MSLVNGPFLVFRFAEKVDQVIQLFLQLYHMPVSQLAQNVNRGSNKYALRLCPLSKCRRGRFALLIETLTAIKIQFLSMG